MHGAWWGKEMCHGGLQQKFAVQYELLRATWRRKIVQDGWLHEGLDSSLPYALFCDASMHACMYGGIWLRLREVGQTIARLTAAVSDAWQTNVASWPFLA